MSEDNNLRDYNQQLEDKAKTADSAERREDYIVLMMAAVAVALVVTGAIGPTFFKSLFF